MKNSKQILKKIMSVMIAMCLLMATPLTSLAADTCTTHTYDDGVVTTEPTCTTNGSITYTCTECGYTYSEKISKTGHDYEETIISPTCTENGYTYHWCTICGATYKTATTKATGHSYVYVSNGDGTHYQKCTVCGDVTDTEDCTKTVSGNKYVCEYCSYSFGNVDTSDTTDKSTDTGSSDTSSGSSSSSTGSSASISCNIKCSWTSKTYVGTVQRPTITVSDSEGNALTYKEDFTVSFSDFNSKDVGTYTATVNFIGDYAGKASQTHSYKIVAQTSVTPVLSRTAITMNGTVQRPTVTVTDKYGNKLTYKTDFTVDYSNWNSKAVGRYTVTVKMIGNYSGSKTYAYYINPKSTTITSITALSKGFTVKWNKQTNSTTGYQIQYATKSDFSNAATIYAGASSATSKTVTGRASKTKYYVRIRTYKNIGGKYFYSDWSSAKTVTTK